MSIRPETPPSPEEHLNILARAQGLLTLSLYKLRQQQKETKNKYIYIKL